MNRVLPPIALALPLAGLLGACSREPPPLPPIEVPLPTAETLPHRINDDCGCVRDGQCVMLEERLGSLEVRGLSCRWVRQNAVALCRFEERFVALDSDAEGNSVETPGEWQARTLRAVLLPNGRWCSG